MKCSSPRASRALTQFGLVLSALALSMPSTAGPVYEVAEVPLTQISADLESGKTSAAAVTRAYIERIKRYDGPLHSVILVAPDAMKQAEDSDKRRQAGKARGPMDGVPILIKDNIDAVGMPTTAGSYALAENFPARDSEVARRLRAAGAIILGKANLDQFASWRATSRPMNGSTVGGGPQNPYRLGYTTSGSSSGPGVAAAASFAAATVGSDTTGSIISPASLMGLVGMRPTLALISRRGVLPVSTSQDTTGPMARNVADTAALLTVLAGSDPEDSLTRDADGHKGDYRHGLDAKALSGARLGVFRGTSSYNERTSPLFNQALTALAAQGATLVEVPRGDLEDLFAEQMHLINYEFKEDVDAYLKTTPPSVKTRTLADIIAFNRTDPRENPYSQELLEASFASQGRADPKYAGTLEYAQRRAGAEGLGAAMAKYGVSALVMLDGGPAQKIGERERRGGSRIYLDPPPKGQGPFSASGIAALAGYPDLSVPIGLVEGLPIGMSLVGPKWSEQHLLSLAYAYEQATKSRVAPEAYLKAGRR